MTPLQLTTVRIGDDVTLTEGRRASIGRVTQLAPKWFMVVWQDGTPEIVKRDESHPLVRRLHLQTPKGTQPASVQPRERSKWHDDN